MKKILLFAAAACTMFMFESCSKSDSSAKAQTQENTVASETVEVYENNVEPVKVLADDELYRPGKATGKVTILDFNATWCMPCKKFAPTFDEAARKYGEDVDFVSVDIDANVNTKQSFGINAVPTVVILDKDGNELKRYEGIAEILPTENFVAIVESYK